MKSKIDIAIIVLSVICISLIVIFIFKFIETNKLIEKASSLKKENAGILEELENVNDSLEAFNKEYENLQNENRKSNEIFSSLSEELRKLKNNPYLKSD